LWIDFATASKTANCQWRVEASRTHVTLFTPRYGRELGQHSSLACLCFFSWLCTMHIY